MNCFESTLVHLTERFNGKEVYLVGTSNQSTMLAQRTQKLIQEIQPDAVLVQTNEKWWETAQLLQYVDSQGEFAQYNKHLDKYTMMQSFYMWHPSRAPLFWFKFNMYSLMFKLHFRIPQNFTFLQPGLEVKFALEEAEKQGAKTYFLGPEFDDGTWNRLYHEKRMNFTSYIWARLKMAGNEFWYAERSEVRSRLHNSEPSQFAEKCLDPYLVNWYIQSLAVFFPKFKSIFIDKRDDELFEKIDKCPE